MNYLQKHLTIVKHLVENTFKHTYKENSIEDILWDVAYNCSKILDLEDFVIYLFNEEKNIFEQKAAYGEKSPEYQIVNDPKTLKPGLGVAGYIGKTGVAEIIGDCTKDPRYLIDDKQRNSEIAVPLIFEDKVIGVLDSEHSQKYFFKQEHLEILKSVSAICAIKIAEMQAHKKVEVLARFFDESKNPTLRIDYDGNVVNKNKAADKVLTHWRVVNKQIVNEEILQTIRDTITLNKEHIIEMTLGEDTYSLNFNCIEGRQYVNVYSSNITDLKRAKLDAENANAIKDKFLSVISHEIRTPLNAIIGTLNLLKSENLNDQQLEYIKGTEFASDKLLTLLNNVLDVEKIEANKLKIDNINFHMGDMLNSLRSSLVFEAQSKNNEIEFFIDDEANQYFYGDETKLFQVLINLLNNAIKFTKEGKIHLRLTKDNQKDDIVYFKFEVKDTGIGISKDKLINIFKPFHQAESSISRRFGGTGLGLSIAKKLIELLGGEIEVSSKVNEGTIFNFSLGFKKSDKTDVTKKEQFVFDSSALQNIIVLLVDDNTINLKIGEQFLKKWGAKVLMAKDGLEAYEVFKSESIDLILMDIHMPKCNGLEATKKIRESGLTNYNIPIIAITADITKNTMEQAKEYTMNSLMSKPFKPKELLNKIKSVIPNNKLD